MTINAARKILGRLAKELSDDEIQRDIKLAEILKNLFFAKMQSNSTSKPLPNMP